MDTLTSAFTTHQHLKALSELKKDQAFSIKINFYAQVFFTIATWIIYLLFGAAMYAAPLWVLQTFFSSNSGNVLAILVLGVFLVVFPTALALGKHAGYHALSKRGVDIRYIGLIVAFFIASGVYFEMTSASSQQQEKANHAVETSNAGKSIMGTQVNNTASTGYAELIANAQLKYDRCLVKLKEGKEKHCDGDKGKLTSLQNQANLEREAVNTANVAAIGEKQAALQKERDAHALPIAKMFQELFSSTIATGAVIAAFVAALIFEISHALTIYNEFRLSDERTQLNKLVTETETRYFSETGKQYDGSDFRESEILDLAEMRKAGKVQHFNDRLSDVPEYHEPAFKEKPAFGFVPANRLSLDEENRKKYPQKILWPTNDRPTPDDYGLVPRIDRNLGTHKPLGQAASGLGIPSHPRPLEATRTDSETSLDDRLKRVADELYPAWIKAIKAKEITSAKEPTQKFIWKHDQRGEGLTVLSANETQRVWAEWQSRALCDGVLVANPKYQQGNRQAKYLLVA